MPDLMRDRALQPPPKHTLQLGNQKELLDRRREELERWVRQGRSSGGRGAGSGRKSGFWLCYEQAPILVKGRASS